MKRKTFDDQQRATIKIPEAARIAGTGIRAIYEGVAAGRIPHLKFGRNILIPRAAFLRWIDSCGREIDPMVPSDGLRADARPARGEALLNVDHA